MKYKLMFLLCLSSCAASTPPSLNADFQIIFPLACQIGETCWVMNYVDHDTRKEAVKDANCEARSYDGHKGTDIAIRDWNQTHKGVDIIAPAPGKVIGVRDGESDQFPTSGQMSAIRSRGRECGNGVRIDHGRGWISQLCHMKNGSVSVASGDIIRTGTKLGEVGMSGITQHPHVHMSLLKNNEVIDPYTGRQASQNCGLSSAQPLWKEAQRYIGFSLYDAGFATGRPNYKAIARGIPSAKPNKKSPDLLFYITYFGARAEDEISLTIRQPDGKIFSEKKLIQKDNKARQNFYFGRKNSSGSFMTGQWTAEAIIYRPDTRERQQVKREIYLKK